MEYKVQYRTTYILSSLSKLTSFLFCVNSFNFFVERNYEMKDIISWNLSAYFLKLLVPNKYILLNKEPAWKLKKVHDISIFCKAKTNKNYGKVSSVKFISSRAILNALSLKSQSNLTLEDGTLLSTGRNVFFKKSRWCGLVLYKAFFIRSL